MVDWSAQTLDALLKIDQPPSPDTLAANQLWLQTDHPGHFFKDSDLTPSARVGRTSTSSGSGSDSAVNSRPLYRRTTSRHGHHRRPSSTEHLCSSDRKYAASGDKENVNAAKASSRTRGGRAVRGEEGAGQGKHGSSLVEADRDREKAAGDDEAAAQRPSKRPRGDASGVSVRAFFLLSTVWTTAIYSLKGIGLFRARY